MREEKRGPVRKKQVGRFQVSIWKRHKVVPARDDFGVEREYDIVRACIQYSQYNRTVGEFERKQIWCNPDELRNLVEALDELGEDIGGDGHE